MKKAAHSRTQMLVKHRACVPRAKAVKGKKFIRLRSRKHIQISHEYVREAVHTVFSAEHF